jgi:hypothetical protein
LDPASRALAIAGGFLSYMTLTPRRVEHGVQHPPDDDTVTAGADDQRAVKASEQT